MKLTATFKPQALHVDLDAQALKTSTGIPVVKEYVERPEYRGSYNVTPSAEEIILNTKYLSMSDNVRVAPIPNNYGLITWNGSTLTVS